MWGMVCVSCALYAQQSVHTSGGDASGIGGSVAFSIGQTAYTTISGSTGTVAQGVQHAYEIYNVHISEIQLPFSLNIFPNPTTDFLTLEISQFNHENLQFHLIDLNGKAIQVEQIVSSNTLIDMNQLRAATYFVHITQNNTIIHTFKIIKNH